MILFPPSGLNRLQSANHRQYMKDLFVELCLTVPVRLRLDCYDNYRLHVQCMVWGVLYTVLLGITIFIYDNHRFVNTRKRKWELNQLILKYKLCDFYLHVQCMRNVIPHVITRVSSIWTINGHWLLQIIRKNVPIKYF